MKNKNMLSYVTVHAIVVAVYLLMFLLIPFAKSRSSWISFGFTLFAIAENAGVGLILLSKDTLKSAFYHVPVFKVGLIYAAAQFLSGLIITVIAAFVDVPYWVSVLFYIILLAVAAIWLIFILSAAKTIEHIDEQTEKQISVNKAFKISVANIIDRCKDVQSLKLLNSLEEEIKFSDPVSSPETEEIENEIMLALDELSSLVKSETYENVKAKTGELINLVKARNRICKAVKR